MSDGTPLRPLRDRLRALAAFLPEMEAPGFEFGKLISPGPEQPGVVSFPFYRYGEIAEALQRTAYEDGWVLEGFDWPEWMRTEEAIRLRDDLEALARATPEQLARMLTVLIRQERFCDGVLMSAFESGLLARILRRAEQLEAELPKEDG